MAGGGLSNILVTVTYVNGTEIRLRGTLASYTRLCHTQIPEYDVNTLDSTLAMMTDTTNQVTALTVNSTKVIEGANAQNITITNFQPTSNGLFLISFPGGSATFYTVGWADKIEFNGVKQTGLGL
jgi:hypothetical protein